MRRVVALFALFAASGCATLVRGRHQEVAFSSSPPGVEVVDDYTGERWTGPETLELERAYAHLLVVSKDGYSTELVSIRSQTHEGWLSVGLLTLGISAVIDMVLGGMYDLEPERVHVVLERESAAVSQP